ncbi:unnamed protein product [Dibothriocephalus latus]|uniref:SF3A2 domain-containing protein n=1 Tax=Dibothriocephalus latus TaxID=60516 RepID=A0A3P7LGL6_DIBLA|nr:unnamed protein product [Dibothriocephalus latus]
MDFQHRVGGKTGSGGVASESEANRDRRERKKHQYNLQRRAAEQARDSPATLQPEKARVEPKKFIKIGRPGYKVTKQKDPETGQQSMLFQIDYPEIADAAGITPRHRFMSAYEQRVEPPDRRWQYLLFAAEPYETIGFKVPSREVDKDPKKLWTFWNPTSKQFFLQVGFVASPPSLLRPLDPLIYFACLAMKGIITAADIPRLVMIQDPGGGRHLCNVCILKGKFGLYFTAVGYTLGAQ